MKKVSHWYTNYNSDNFERKEFFSFNDLVLEESEDVKWLEITSLADLDLINDIANKFNLHPLVVEDILDLDHMSKLQDYNEYLYLIIDGMVMDENKKIKIEQYSFILFKNLIISFQQSETKVFDSIITRIKEGSNIRKNGADDLLYALVDAIVDDYFEVVEEIGEYIDEVEDQVLLNPKKESLQEIYRIKRDLIYIRKALWPMRNAISGISKNDYDLIDEKTLYYFRDVYDHVIQLIDIIETYRDICSGMLDTYLSSISNKTNEIMKVLTIFSSIFIPLTFLAGVYGMNFKYLPELNWKYGYLSFWIISTIIILVLLRYFKKKNWF
ncbi:MAG: magnesium/cobalt transporter CorA [Erysipelothrix sp.]|nr:magnesium/cobalt transporter CorA [Erysipelothrix sp.]